MRNSNIDFIKGLLIIIVIVGHVIQDEVSDNIIRYSIYSFHMPIFIGISGYLLNLEKFRHITFSQLISKYYNRLIIPYIVALLIYILLSKFYQPHSIFNIKYIFHSLITPYYHLWYIPALIFWIILTYYLNKYLHNKKEIIIYGSILSVIFSLINISELNNDSTTNKLLNIICYTLRPQYYIFFLAGIWLKEYTLKISNRITVITILFSIIINLILFKYPIPLISIFSILLLNISLLYVVKNIINCKEISGLKIINWLGINSLGIYLWHAMPIVIIKFIFKISVPSLFYPFTIFSIIAIIYILYLLSQNNIIKKLFWGT